MYEGGSGLDQRIEAGNPGYADAIVFLISAATWSAIAAAAFYPAFQAMVLRWWIGGLRFGDLTVTSKLRTGQVYRAYVRLLLYGLLFGLALSVAGAMAFALMELVKRTIEIPEIQELVTVGAMAIGYMIFALGYSTIYQATVKLTLWRAGMETVEISGVDALNRVKAAGRAASPVGEGLADALQVGGI